jgi:hypothetical protein
LTSRELDVGGRCLQQVRGDLLALLLDLVERHEDGGAAHGGGAAAVGAHAEGDGPGIAVDDLDVIHGHAQFARHELREGRFMALAVRVRARVHRHLARGMHAHRPRLVEPGPRAQGADHLRGRDGARFDVCREAHPEQATLLARLGLLGPELLVVEDLQELVEGRAVVATVVGHGHQGLEGPGKLGDEVLSPDLGHIHLECRRPGLDHSLHDVGRLGPPRAAVGVDGRGVGEHAGDLAVDGADGVDAVEQRTVQKRRHGRGERRQVRPQIGRGLDAQAEDLAVAGQRDLGVGDVIAPVGVGQIRLAPGGRPPDGPPDLAGGPRDHHLFVVDKDLGAESPAHVGRDHPHLVLGDPQHEGGHEQAVHVGILRGHPQGQLSGRLVEARHARPGLHGVGHQSLVDDAPLDLHGGRGEGGVGGGPIANLPFEGHVAGHRGVHQRLTGLGRFLGAGDGRHRLPVHHHLLGSVERGRVAVGDDDGHRIAHAARRVRGQRHVRRHDEVLDHPGDVLVLAQVPPARQRVDSGHVLAGEDGHDPRVRLGPRGVDPTDARVRMGAAHEGGVGHSGQPDVVDVLTAPGDESRILAALDGLAVDTRLRHR